jgi:hypothetical protein
MTHQQILDKLAAKSLVMAMEEDLSRLMYFAMTYQKHGTVKDLDTYVLTKLLIRWNCVFRASDVSDNYKHKAWLSLATLLHKSGIKNDTITQHATHAIDALNDKVVLSDDFNKRSEEIKKMLLTQPVPLKRRPNHPESITFYRAEDVISIQIGKQYFAAYVHQITGANESPVIELYEQAFTEIPTLEQLQHMKAKGAVYKDGNEYIWMHGVYGMKFMPDPANQIKLIASGVKQKPDNTHLNEMGWTVSNIFNLQDDIKRVFKLK